MRRLLFLLLMILTTGLSCPSTNEGVPATLEDNDAGDAAWAREASLLIWGRLPRSVQETAALAALVGESDRASVARAMTRTVDYRDRWEVAVLDLLGVSRAGMESNPGCHHLSTLEDASDLAEFVSENGPLDSTYSSEFTQLDLLRSALIADDLRPAFRANLYHLQYTPAAQSLSEDLGLRRHFAELFQSVYLGRDVGCLGCHNSEFAVSDNEDPELDHHWPLAGNVERAVFGAPEGIGTDEFALMFRRRGVKYRHWWSKENPAPEPGGTSALDGCASTQRIACADCPCEEAVCDAMPECCTVEWGPACAEACSDLDGCQSDEDPLRNDGCFEIQGAGGGCPGCSCEEYVCDVMPGCCDGAVWTHACATVCAAAPGSECEPHPEAVESVRPWGMHPSCGEYLAESEIQEDVTAGTAFFIDSFDSSASIHELEALLHVGMEQLGDGALAPAPDGTVDGPEAFAWMTASHFADRVWKMAMGTPLTLSNGFPRNSPQQMTLALLTSTFVTEGWSLAELLVTIVTHPTFNQRAPEDVVVGSPYYLDRLFEPFSGEAANPEHHANSRGDVLHRRDGRLLQRMVYEALEWPEPQIFQSLVTYEMGLQDLDYQIGAFRQPSAPGHGGVGFQDLLRWEDSLADCRDPFDRPPNPDCEVRDEACPECVCAPLVCPLRPECCFDVWGPECVALCEYASPACVLPDRGEDYAFRPDWVDSLAEAGQGGTWSDAIRALKERLISDPTLQEEEIPLFQSLLALPLTAALPADPTEGLRAVCGVLLSTPQFLLAGDPGPAEVPPSAPVYPPGASFIESCEWFAETMYDPGRLTCADASLTLR
jgi:hypothetical protein